MKDPEGAVQWLSPTSVVTTGEKLFIVPQLGLLNRKNFSLQIYFLLYKKKVYLISFVLFHTDRSAYNEEREQPFRTIYRQPHLRDSILNT